MDHFAIGRANRHFPVLLLTGPRQVGKTSVLRHLSGDDRAYKDKVEIDLLMVVGDTAHPSK